MNGTDINVGTKGVKMMFIVTWIDGKCQFEKDLEG